MSAHQPSVTEGKASGSPRLFRWVLWSCVALIGVLGGLLIGLITTSHKSAAVPNGPVGPVGPAATWSAGAKLAPGFSLTDQSRQAGLARRVPRAAGDRHVHRPALPELLPARGEGPERRRRASSRRRSGPRSSRSASISGATRTGTSCRTSTSGGSRRSGAGASAARGSSQSVWKAYQIEVLDQPKTIAGVTVHQITHTEGAFIVDPSGHQRALYLWPFRAVDVTHTLRQLAASS